MFTEIKLIEKRIIKEQFIIVLSNVCIDLSGSPLKVALGSVIFQFPHIYSCFKISKQLVYLTIRILQAGVPFEYIVIEGEIVLIISLVEKLSSVNLPMVY